MCFVSKGNARSGTGGIAALSSGCASDCSLLPLHYSLRRKQLLTNTSRLAAVILISVAVRAFNVADNITADELTAYELGATRATLYSDTSITLNDVSDSSYGRGNGDNELFRDSSHPTAYCSYSYYLSSCAIAEADMAIGDEPWVTDDNFNSYTFGVSGRFFDRYSRP